MRIRLKQDYDFKVPGFARSVVAFKAGKECIVKRDWGEAMVAAKVAEEVVKTEPEPEPNAD